MKTWKVATVKAVKVARYIVIKTNYEAIQKFFDHTLQSVPLFTIPKISRSKQKRNILI